MKRLLVLLILAGLLRAVMLWAVVQYPDRAIRRDSEEYILVARNLLAGHGISLQHNPPFTPTAFRTPVFPLMIAMIYKVFGINNIAVVLVQIVISLLTVGLTYWLGRLLFSESEAWSGALLFSLSSAPAVYAVFIWSETLFTLLLLLNLLCLVFYQERKSAGWLAAAALLAGLMILCRPVAVLFPALIIVLIWLAEPQKWRKALVRGAAFLIACGLTLSPWILRNMVQLGTPTISTISSNYLLFYNAASLVADQEGISQAQAYKELETRVGVELAALPGPITEAVQSKLYSDLGRRIILAHPFRFIFIHLKEDLNNFLPDVTDFLELMGVTQGAKGTLSVLNQYGLIAAIDHYFAGKTWLIAFVSPWIVLLGWIYLTDLSGIYTLIKRKHWFGLALLSLPVLYFMLMPGASSNPRFRVPVMPYLCLLGGVGCSQLAAWMNGVLKRRVKGV